MAKRAKRKQTLFGTGTECLQNIATTAPKAGIHEFLSEKDDEFIRSVKARNSVMDLIDRNEALKKRIQEVYEEGRKAGFKQAGMPVIKCCMAGACIMMQEVFNMDDDDIVRGLSVLYEKIVWALEFSSMADEVLEKTGIELRFDDPVDPVRSVKKEG